MVNWKPFAVSPGRHTHAQGSLTHRTWRGPGHCSTPGMSHTGQSRERVLDYVAVRLAKPDSPAPLLCLVGPSGVGKSWLARLVAATIRRACAWVACGELCSAADVHGAHAGAPGRIVEQLRRVDVANPVFILDELDRLDEKDDVAAALLEALDSAPNAAFRDRLCRPALRPVGRALRGHGDQPWPGAGDAAGRDGGGRAARLHRRGEARHRGRAPAAVAARRPRPDRRSGPGHRRSDGGHHQRLHPGSGGVGTGQCAWPRSAPR